MKIRSLLLPREYQQVECIESSGTQYIDTGLGMKASLSFDLTILPANRGTDERFLGAYGSGIYIGQLSSKWRYGNSCTYNDVAIDYDNPTRITIFNGNQWTFNDVTKTASLGTNNQKLVIFAATYQTNPNVPYGYGSCKLYSCKIYDNNVLIRNYIPCYRKSDNVIGLYDLANGTFYTNAGSGTFLKGDNVKDSFKISTAITEGTTNLNKIIIKCQIPGFIYGYNQLFYPTTAGNWVGNAASATFSNGILTATSTSTASYWGVQHVSNKSASFYKNHKYYFSAECYPDTVAGNGSNTGLNLYSTNSGYVYQQSKAIPEKTWTRIESIFTVNKDSSGTIYPWIFTNQRNDRTIGDKVSIKNAMLIDLTEWYGAGNEPTSTSMFYNTFPNLFYPVQQTVIKLLIDKINKL